MVKLLMDILRFRRSVARAFSAFCTAPALVAATAAVTSPTAEEFPRDIRPLLQRVCLDCHSTAKHKGDLDLERFASYADILSQPKAWMEVVNQVSLGEMPPKEKPQPTDEERARLLDWVSRALDEAARARAGDPGPVVLRRLNNTEYTFTVRDLTGVSTLSPTKEFPADSAAGEGFLNTGQALVMSPALFSKYLDAGKDIAAHAVLLPDGLRFSSSTTRRDWTEELLAQIRGLYRDYTDARGADRVNLQGIVFDTNEGGRLPLERYLEATLTDGAALRADPGSVGEIARKQHLSPKYLGSLWHLLTTETTSPLLAPLQARWRQAKPGDGVALAQGFAPWQQALWKFSSVGHIGKAGGPKAWMEPVTPLAAQQEFRLKLAAPTNGTEVTVYLAAGDAGDGSVNDFVVWQQPRLVRPGYPDLPLKDVRSYVGALASQRERLFAGTVPSLAAVAEAAASKEAIDIPALAQRHVLEPEVLRAWLALLGVGTLGPLDHFTTQLRRVSNFDFVNGWGSGETPSVMANASGEAVRIPGKLKPHGVVMHPSPKLQVAAGWSSPLAGRVQVEAHITHAHPECGNGVAWSLEVRRGSTRQRLASGIAQGNAEKVAGPFDAVAVRPGDLISLLIDPRDGNHSCDLTDVELRVRAEGDGGREWVLTRDVSGDVLAANPHADSFGNPGIWHFYTEPVTGAALAPVIPPGSLLARWQAAGTDGERATLATELQRLLTGGVPPDAATPDGRLFQQLNSLGGPLLQAARGLPAVSPAPAAAAAAVWSLAPEMFRRVAPGSPGRTAPEATSLAVAAPSVLEIRLPADLVAGAEFVTTGVLDAEVGAEGSVQLQVLTTKPAGDGGLLPSGTTVTQGSGPWTSDTRQLSHRSPVITREGSSARRRWERAFEEFRNQFPAALCYVKIVPVDEVVTLTLYHREDGQLARLMLDDAQAARLDRLWDELHYVSQDALTLVDAYEQLWQYATQDADPKVFEPMRKPIYERAAAFKQKLIDTQPRHLDAVLKFAHEAYRRPLTTEEGTELRGLYDRLRKEELPHDAAIRLMVARILVTPAFLYRLEQAGPARDAVPVTEWELATRLSYFLWSSTPDAELTSMAAAGLLHDPEVLVGQARRMLHDGRVRRLATEFGCAWLHLHDFEASDEKSERHFPTFAGLRGDMYEEVVRYLTDLFQNGGSVMSVFQSDYTFLNEALAKHYGIPNVTGPEWRRVDGVQAFGRGGVLGFGATLARQSGASRTSPILRGNWVSEVLLGEKLPRPPKDVPRLPEDEAAETLTVRQLTEKHSSDPRCSGCHRRIDGFGFALEAYDAIGRWRTKDLGDRPLDTATALFDGTRVKDATDLRQYLVSQKRKVVRRHFSRMLVGYALGRGVRLSDQPLITQMQKDLEANGNRFSVAVETLVRSRQFREIRGREMASDD